MSLEPIARGKDDISLALATDSLSPEDAGRLAGRLSFLTQAVFEFGAVGKAAPAPVLTIPRHGGPRPPTAQ